MVGGDLAKKKDRRSVCLSLEIEASKHLHRTLSKIIPKCTRKKKEKFFFPLILETCSISIALSIIGIFSPQYFSYMRREERANIKELSRKKVLKDEGLKTFLWEISLRSEK